MRIAVLISGKGSNLSSVVEAQKAGQLGSATVEVVIADKHCSGLLVATNEGIPTVVADSDRNIVIEETLTQYGIELVVCAGFMRILPKQLVCDRDWQVINIHPSLLPLHPGLRAVEQALADGSTKTGCTVHYVDEFIDHGQTIAQVEVPIQESDTPETLHVRIQKEEHQLLPLVIKQLALRRQ